jgi:Polyketide cyclase / dehydrase and lipid transport
LGTFSLEVTIAKPPDIVFGRVTDPRRMPDWQTGIVAVSQEPEGPIQVGTRIHRIRKAPIGRGFAFTEEIFEWDPVRFVCSGKVITSLIRGTTYRWNVEEIGGGSHLRLDSEVRAVGLWQVLAPVLTPAIRNQLQQEMERLKHLLEGGE